MSTVDKIAELAATGDNYKKRLFSVERPGGVSVSDAFNTLNSYAQAAQGNIEDYPRFFESVYQAMISMRVIGAGNLDSDADEYSNIEFMSYNMLDDASASGSTNMQEAFKYIQQFVR
jgi:hypothetical protein